MRVAVRRSLVAIGSGDAATGVALIAVPDLTLGMLGLAPVAAPASIFVRWIGVFVLAIGVAYLLPFTATGEERVARLRGAVAFTALARLLVAAFVAFAVMTGGLGEGWCLVGAYDSLVAIAQLALVARGGLDEAG